MNFRCARNDKCLEHWPHKLNCKLLTSIEPKGFRQLKERASKDDSTDLEVRVLQQEGVEDHASHAVAPEESRDSISELFYQSGDVEVKVFYAGTFAAHSS